LTLKKKTSLKLLHSSLWRR